VRQFTLKLSRLAALPAAGGSLEAETQAAAPLSSAPGQFYLARAVGAVPEAYLRQPVFAGPQTDGRTTLELPAAWAHLQPGDELDLIGPCGRASDLPEHARNVLLIAGPGGAGRVLPHARAAIDRRASVVLVSTEPQPISDLPAEIEIRFGLEGLAEALAWADVIYADAPFEHLRQLQSRMRAATAQGTRPAGPPARAYCLPATPCGVGACGACAVPTTRGWRLACVEGAWFDLLELEL
jgi:dihydroorotate dehydrogenase electron transfer subunit